MRDHKIVVPATRHLERTDNGTNAKGERRIFKNHLRTDPDRIKQDVDRLLRTDQDSSKTPFFRRFGDAERYALCTCYLLETEQSVVDNLVDMNARFLIDTERETKNIYEAAHRKLRKRLRRGIPTFYALLPT